MPTVIIDAMDIIKYWVGYGLLIAALWAAITYIPRFQRATPEYGYQDIAGLERYASGKVVDAERLTRLKVGDAVCFSTGSKKEFQVLFGWVAAMPGQVVALQNQKVIVDGKPTATPHDAMSVPDLPGSVVPRGHVFIISTSHQYDSIANGMIPLGALRGTVDDL
jgi:hypothetical protein